VRNPPLSIHSSTAFASPRRNTSSETRRSV